MESFLDTHLNYFKYTDKGVAKTNASVVVVLIIGLYPSVVFGCHLGSNKSNILDPSCHTKMICILFIFTEYG